MAQTIAQQLAVGQAGEMVIKRQVLDLALGSLAFGDVGIDPQDGIRHLLFVAQQGPVSFDDERAAILAPLHDFAVPFAQFPDCTRALVEVIRIGIQ